MIVYATSYALLGLERVFPNMLEMLFMQQDFSQKNAASLLHLRSSLRQQ